MKRLLSLISAMLLAFVASSHAQEAPPATNFSYSTAPPPKEERVVIREAWKPGMYCAIRRPSYSFEEVLFVTASSQFLQVKAMKLCLKELPVGYATYIAPAPVLHLEKQSPVARSGSVSCSFLEPIGAPIRTVLSYASGIVPKQEEIDNCLLDLTRLKAQMEMLPSRSPQKGAGSI